MGDYYNEGKIQKGVSELATIIIISDDKIETGDIPNGMLHALTGAASAFIHNKETGVSAASTVTASTSQLTNTPASAPAAQPVSAPADQPVSAPAAQSVSAPADQPVSVPAAQPVSAPANQPNSTPTASTATALDNGAILSPEVIAAISSAVAAAVPATPAS